MTQAIIDGQITVSGMDPGSIAALRRALSYRNPEALNAQKVATPISEDQDIPEMLSALIELPNGDVVFPRGAIGRAKPFFRRGFQGWIDHRSSGKRIDLHLQPGFEPRYYQHLVATEAYECTQGLVVLPCGAGKTAAAITAMAKVGRNTLVIVPTRALVQQWKTVCQEFLGITPAIFGSGKHEFGPVTISTKDALSYHLSNITDQLSQFGMLVIDECHRVPTEIFRNVVSKIPAKWRIGLSATPDREDGQTPLIHWTFGNVLLEKKTDDMVNEGWLTRPTVKAIYTKFFYDLPDKDERQWADYGKLNKAITTNFERNKLICDIMIDHLKKDKDGTALILTNSIDHCNTLTTILKNRGVESASVISSKVRKKKQSELINGLRDGSIRIACATSIADEGLDIRRLSGICLALPQGSKRNTVQKVGRSMRPCGTKTATIYDIVDEKTENLLNRWERRRSVFRSMNLEIEECQTGNLFSREIGLI